MGPLEEQPVLLTSAHLLSSPPISAHLSSPPIISAHLLSSPPISAHLSSPPILV